MSQTSLFEAVADSSHIPLAEQLRPRTLGEFVGQHHLLDDGMPLQIAFASGKLHSLILWGPPGVGKTTLARLMAQHFDAEFIPLSAVFSGVKDIRDAVAQAQLYQSQGRHTILFVDEVHRFNKAQQDAFLPFVEQGLVTFVGATTENPSFEVNSALLSRAQVYRLQALDDADLMLLVQRAMQVLHLQIDAGAGGLLVSYADGDARRLFNLLEQIDTAAKTRQVDVVGEAFAASVLARQSRRFDKGGDEFYDQISALHKSVRGSNPDAALYWLVRMLDGGADPLYLGRRLVRMASEDIGLADPRALTMALDACATYERLGSPEGELTLAQAAVYLAVAPKSNALYVAYNDARAWVRQDKSRPVPVHLRNAPTKLMKEMGYGKTYRYAHDEPDAYAAGETYLPDDMPEQHFYQPTARGLEGKISERLAYLRSLDRKASKK